MSSLVAVLLFMAPALSAGMGLKGSRHLQKAARAADIDAATGLEEGGWNDPNLILDHGHWWRLPEPFFKPSDPRPHPPVADYHSEATRNSSSIIVLIAALSESKVATTLKTMYERARVPSRVYAGVVQQNNAHDRDALEGFCADLGTPLQLKDEFHNRENLHRRQGDEDHWGHERYTRESLAACEPASRIRMYRMDADEAKGPAYARGRQPLLLSEGDKLEDFCMQIDAHTVFTKDWDETVVQQWADTDNEYAVLSTYPTNARDLNADGTPQNSNNHWEMPHLCGAASAGNGLVRNDQASAAAGLTRPALGKLWAAGLSFSKCHAERDVPADPNLMHVFNGEEFGRGARLWTNGYDFYSPPRPVIGTWYGGEKGGGGGWHSDYSESRLASSRLATLLEHHASSRSEEALAALQGYGLGTRRSLDEYIRLTGMDTRTGRYTKTPCAVTKWTPWREGAQPPYEMLRDSPVVVGEDAKLRQKAFV